MVVCVIALSSAPAAGMARGGEWGWDQFYLTVHADGSAGGGSWYGVYRHMVFEDPDWRLPQLDFDRDPHAAVVARSSRERVDQYYRLFMVPGMLHPPRESQ